MSDNKLYRCGWCGFPCDSEGEPLKMDFDRADDYLKEREGLEEVLVSGYCCAEQQLDNDHRHSVVTRDMAIDAGDLSLEVW